MNASKDLLHSIGRDHNLGREKGTRRYSKAHDQASKGPICWIFSSFFYILNRFNGKTCLSRQFFLSKPKLFSCM